MDDLLPGTLQWWHYVLGIFFAAFTLAMKWFGDAFKNWADKLETFQRTVEKRLDHVERSFATQGREMADRFDTHRDHIHSLTVRMERRMTWVEAVLRKVPNSAEEHQQHRRWYEGRAHPPHPDDEEDA